MTIRESLREDDAAHLAQRLRPECARSPEDAGTASKRFHQRYRLEPWSQRVSRRVSSALNCVLVVGGIMVICIVP
jgi:hypothetical protein